MKNYFKRLWNALWNSTTIDEKAEAALKETKTRLKEMKKDPAGVDSCVIGKVTNKYPGNVFVRSSFGSERIIDIMYGDQLPRIC